MALRKNRSPMLCWHPPQVSREGGIWRTSSTGSLHNAQHGLGEQILLPPVGPLYAHLYLQFEAVHLREPLDVIKASTALFKNSSSSFLSSNGSLMLLKSSSSTQTGGPTDHSVCTCFFIDKLQTLSVAFTRTIIQRFCRSSESCSP